jgi:hypothetical protein
MKLAKRLFMGIGGMVVAAALLTLVAPKTAHGLVTALVQVANTVANPAITEDTPHLASQIVELYCQNFSSSADGSPCQQVAPGGGLIESSYFVPSGQNLVITNVEMPTSGGGGHSLMTLTGYCTGLCTVASRNWVVDNDGLTHEFQLSPGFVMPGGSGVSTLGTSEATMFIRGYLTAN